jgi:hypothetical protein
MDEYNIEGTKIKIMDTKKKKTFAPYMVCRVFVLEMGSALMVIEFGWFDRRVWIIGF